MEPSVKKFVDDCVGSYHDNCSEECLLELLADDDLLIAETERVNKHRGENQPAWVVRAAIALAYFMQHGVIDWADWARDGVPGAGNGQG